MLPMGAGLRPSNQTRTAPLWVHVPFFVCAARRATEGSLRGGMSTLTGETAFFVQPFCACGAGTALLLNRAVYAALSENF